jgi:Flp pilus assembly protein TadB
MSGLNPFQAAQRTDRDIFAMKLLAFYIVFVVIGLAIAYVIGRTVENWSAAASLPVFLACFFFVFWAAWRLAVRVT